MELHFCVALTLGMQPSVSVHLASERPEKNQEGSPCLETSKGKLVQTRESQSTICINQWTPPKLEQCKDREGENVVAAEDSLRSSQLKHGSQGIGTRIKF